MVFLSKFFHLHVDGLTEVPQKLENLLGSYNIFSDDFEHYFEFENQKLRPHHFTRILKKDQQDHAQEIFENLSKELTDLNFCGHMQLEVIEELIHLGPHIVELENNDVPFEISQVRSNEYKTHELHLKILSTELSTISLLQKTGMNFLEIKNYCYFTASGHEVIIKDIFKLLKLWLSQRTINTRIEIIFETTLKHKVFQITPKSFQDTATY